MYWLLYMLCQDSNRGTRCLSWSFRPWLDWAKALNTHTDTHTVGIVGRSSGPRVKEGPTDGVRTHGCTGLRELERPGMVGVCFGLKPVADGRTDGRSDANDFDSMCVAARR